jgi:hypothetical protein
MLEVEAGPPGRGEEPEPVSPLKKEAGEVDLQLRLLLRSEYSALRHQIRGIGHVSTRN